MPEPKPLEERRCSACGAPLVIVELPNNCQTFYYDCVCAEDSAKHWLIRVWQTALEESP